MRVSYFSLLSLCIISTVIIYHFNKENPFSPAFYLNNHNKVEFIQNVFDLNAHRLNMVKRFSQPKQILRLNPKLLLTIITQPRKSRFPDQKYLLQVAMTLLHATVNISDVGMIICDANLDELVHEDLDELLSVLDGNISVYRKCLYQKQRCESPEYKTTAKNRLDLAFCLKKSASHNASYIIAIEDDAIPIQPMGFSFKKSLESLTYFLDRHSNILALKLNFPLDIAGFHQFWLYALEFICLWMLILSGFYFVVCFFQIHFNRSKFSFLTFAVFAALTLGIIGRPFFVYARSSITRRFTIQPSPDCCTATVVYPRQAALEFANYLETLPVELDLPIDYALSEFASKTKKDILLALPNLFEHIGMISSQRSHRDLNPYPYILSDFDKISIN